MAISARSKAEINMTPMIDVLLVLIIIFMVIVAQSKEKGLTAQIPQPAKEDATPEMVRTIVIQVGETKSGEPPALKIKPAAGQLARAKAKTRGHFQNASGEGGIRPRGRRSRFRIRR